MERIWVVDDDPAAAYLNQLVIEEAKLADQVVHRANGKEALRGLLDDQAKGRPWPELILLDLNMPVMDGFAFLQEIRQGNSGLGALMDRIVVLTSSGNARDLEKAHQLGVHWYVLKPLTREGLASVLLSLTQGLESFPASQQAGHQTGSRG